MPIQDIVQTSRFTILLGKNGAGKSTLLRALAQNEATSIKYISPERGGTLKHDPGVETNIASNDNWIRKTRMKNRFEQFREQSIAQYRMLEILILREIERDPAKRADASYTFQRVVLEKINALLPAVKMIQSDRGFSIQSKSGTAIPEDQISSGEAELIALAIEVLVFSRASDANKMLLLDEPDVHLHPDLQQKFIEFVQLTAEQHDLRVVIATHSTAITGAFSSTADLQIVPVSERGQTSFSPFRPSKIANEILPVFGVHPLSNAFNRSPVVLVEGEDDKRVLEQIVRTSRGGSYSWSPCPVDSVSALAEWEEWLNQVLPALYDKPIAYSLRDLDDAQQTEITDVGIVCRIRLNCYAIENILLSEQCFADHGLDANSFLDLFRKWGSEYPHHQFVKEAAALAERFGDRRTIKIKNLRNIIVALIGSNKPWEVVVANVIAKHAAKEADWSDHSVHTYLGKKAVERLFLQGSAHGAGKPTCAGAPNQSGDLATVSA